MGNINRTWALILISVIAISCITLLSVKPANAQTIPKPSAPTFTVKLVDNSYTTPIIATSSTDPYTNKTTINQSGGQYIKNFTIEIIITNQALPSSVNDGKHSIYYIIRFKPHFAENGYDQYGTLMPCNNSLAPDPADASVTEYFANVIPKQSDGLYTTFPIDGNYYNQSDQIDFQVKAVIGHTFNRWVVSEVVSYFGGVPHYGGDGPPIALPAITQDSEGNWSAIQTLTIDYSPSNVNTSPKQPNSTLIISYALIAITAVIAIVISLLFHRRHRKTAYLKHDLFLKKRAYRRDPCKAESELFYI